MYDIRDPIHRTIGFSEREKRVIDHPLVQRLRHVRQLGLASVAYPGATHDRFGHALGAMHVAGRMWARMTESGAEVLQVHFGDDDLALLGRTVRLAALLHDLGHAPFSHISERFMPPFARLAVPQGWFERGYGEGTQAVHEDFSVLLIAALSDASLSGRGAVLTEDEARDVASLVHHHVSPSASWQSRFGESEQGGKRGIHRLLRSMVSGELDADRMDYLLRDAHFTGVAYGAYDIDHLIANLGLVELPGQGLIRTIDSTAVRAFEDFLLARYHMFPQVYVHKTVLAFDHFLEQAIVSGEFMLDIPGDANGYGELRDGAVIERWFEAARDPAKRWSRRLARREPATLVLRADRTRQEDRDLLARVTAALELAGVPYFQVDSHQYLSKSQASVEGVGGPSSMLVRSKRFGKVCYEPIERASELLARYSPRIDLVHLYVLPEHRLAADAAIAPFAQ